MDYGSMVLPRTIPALGKVSRQSRFDGSVRQIRGEIIRQLTSQRSTTVARVAKKMNRSVEEVRTAANALAQEGVVIVSASRIRLLE